MSTEDKASKLAREIAQLFRSLERQYGSGRALDRQIESHVAALLRPILGAARHGGEQMKLATQVVHWPGKDTYACDEHANKLFVLAGVLGFQLSVTVCDTNTPCSNCVNEARVSAVKEPR